jgi:hypothetical protein
MVMILNGSATTFCVRKPPGVDSKQTNIEQTTGPASPRESRWRVPSRASARRDVVRRVRPRQREGTDMLHGQWRGNGSCATHTDRPSRQHTHTHTHTHTWESSTGSKHRRRFTQPVVGRRSSGRRPLPSDREGAPCCVARFHGRVVRAQVPLWVSCVGSMWRVRPRRRTLPVTRHGSRPGRLGRISADLPTRAHVVRRRQR